MRNHFNAFSPLLTPVTTASRLLQSIWSCPDVAGLSEVHCAIRFPKQYLHGDDVEDVLLFSSPEAFFLC